MKKSLVQSGETLTSDRKSTRLNSSHQIISYAVFCLKKKKPNRTDVLNAMDVRTHEELGEILDDVERGDNLWVTALPSAGDLSLSVGQDRKVPTRRNGQGVAPVTSGSGGLPGSPRLT